MRRRIESVKTRFSSKNRSDTLIELSKTTEELKIKSEIICLPTYEMDNFEFLLGIIFGMK